MQLDFQQWLESDDHKYDADELQFKPYKLCNIPNIIADKLLKYTKLQTLVMNDCTIKSLKKFPVIPSLTKLELMANWIPDGQLIYLRDLANLNFLWLTANHLVSIESLCILNTLKSLCQLDLQENVLVQTNQYRQKVFSIFPNLLILDNHYESGSPVIYDEDENEGNEEKEYGWLKPIHPRQDSDEENVD